MLERDAVTAAIAEVVGAIQTGRGRSLFVTGEAGLGKSSVLDHARSHAGPGVAVGGGRGDPVETSLPFGLAVQAIEALGGRGVIGTPGLGPGGDARAAQFYGVQRWLESQDGRPVLLLLDDMHWADPDSLALLSFLCRRVAHLAVGVIGALRPWPPEAHQLASELAADGLAALAALAPLSDAASSSLLAAHMTRAVDVSITDRARAACAGNPLLLQQVAAAIDAGEDLWAMGPGPSGARQLVLTRFGGLSAPAMSVARAASTLGTPFPPELAAAVAEAAAPDLGHVFDALWRSGLFRAQRDGAMEFVHPLFRQALYDDLGPPLQAELHARAFRLLEARGRDAEAAEHAIRARLVGDPQAIAVLERVGRAAHRSGAILAAAAHLQTAYDYAGTRASPGLRLELAAVALGLGRLSDALGIAAALVGEPEASVPERIAALRLLGRALTISNAPDEAAARFDHAVELAEPQDPTVAVEVLLDYAMASWLTAGPAKSLPLVARARDIAPMVGRTLRLRAEVAWGHMALEAGDGSGAASLASLPALEACLASDVIEASGFWGPFENSFVVLAALERFEEAERVFELADTAARRIGAPESMATLATARAFFLLRSGRIVESLASMDVVASVADLVPMMALYVPLGRAAILQHLGRLRESDAYLAQAKATTALSDFWNAHLYLWWFQGHRHLLEGRPAQACELYGRLEDLAGRMGERNPCLPPWAGHAIAAHIAAGHEAEAARLVDWLEERAGCLPVRWPRIAAAVGRAVLAERAADREGAEAHFMAALAMHDQVTLPLDHIETLMGYGAFLRRSGRLGPAREALAQAVALADATGAAWLGGYARQELAMAGGRRRAPRPPDQLTPAEQRVARLAAAGASNAAIARQMVVSVATIETHLSHIYAKLGVHSRRELATATAFDAAEPPQRQP